MLYFVVTVLQEFMVTLVGFGSYVRGLEFYNCKEEVIIGRKDSLASKNQMNERKTVACHCFVIPVGSAL